jgi:hypothetical protein
LEATVLSFLKNIFLLIANVLGTLEGRSEEMDG